MTALDAFRGTCPSGLSLIAHVKNVGSVAAPGGVNVSFYRGAAPNGVPIATRKTTGPLPPEGVEDVTFLVPQPDANVASAYYAVADDDGMGKGAVQECNEANNQAALAPSACGKD